MAPLRTSRCPVRQSVDDLHDVFSQIIKSMIKYLIPEDVTGTSKDDNLIGG